MVSKPVLSAIVSEAVELERRSRVDVMIVMDACVTHVALSSRKNAHYVS